MTTPLFTTADWDYPMIRRIHDAIEPIAVGEMGLDVYPNQIEIITSEQMLDAYTSTGMPLMYSHWSFGKQFAREELLYRKGAQSLAYELVINSDPCVSYVMEENTATMQTLVIAHAAFGHNHFFKNNHTFKTWTHADSVLDDLAFAKRFIADCESRHGLAEVESILDAAHSLMNYGVTRYASRSHPKDHGRLKAEARAAYREEHYDDLFERTRPNVKGEPPVEVPPDGLDLPEENLLLFLARYAPKLEDWQREILHIVRRMSQYFYPQRQTKLMNEGCATWVHYRIMNRMYDLGLLTEGSMLEFLRSHSAVVMQPDFDDRRYGGINPYALGFAMMSDIERMCVEPTDEDRRWFPEVAGCGRPLEVLREAWAEYRDESFVRQFLSPRLIREMHLFRVHDDSDDPVLTVDAIHDEAGYESIRHALASNYDIAHREPQIEITDADLSGSRRLTLTHRIRGGRQLNVDPCNRTLQHVARLWGYRVRLIEVDADDDSVMNQYESVPLP